MKTTYEMLVKAVSIADNDPNARIGMFCNFRDMVGEPWPGDGVYSSYNKTKYTSHSNGVVYMHDTANFDAHNFSGAQYSHIFYDETLSLLEKNYLKCRVRTTNKHPEPSGAYSSYGVVTRTEVWN